MIHEFNEKGDTREVSLHPEFGNWMIEAVPTDPYGAMEDLSSLLTCFNKLSKRYLFIIIIYVIRRHILLEYL